MAGLRRVMDFPGPSQVLIRSSTDNPITSSEVRDLAIEQFLWSVLVDRPLVVQYLGLPVPSTGVAVVGPSEDFTTAPRGKCALCLILSEMRWINLGRQCKAVHSRHLVLLLSGIQSQISS